MFERMTNRTEGGIAYTKIPANPSNMIDVGECYTGRVVDRIAAYEDSGLSPEDIETLQRENKQLKAVLKQARAVLEEIEKCCEINIDDGYHACQRKCREATARARFFRGVIDELEGSE